VSHGRVNLLGVCASPRRGNTLFLLRRALESIKNLPQAGIVDVEEADLRSTKMAPCASCEGCAKERRVARPGRFPESAGPMGAGGKHPLLRPSLSPRHSRATRMFLRSAGE
jgi:hypothetical protein